MQRYLFALVLLWGSLSGSTFACSCGGSAKRPCEYLRASAIFVGTVAETVPFERPNETIWKHGYAMRFIVNEALHGELDQQVVVDTGSGGGDCGTPLPAGGKYLIFAYRDNNGQLWTGLCAGNRPLTGTAEDQAMLQLLRATEKKGSGSISGFVMRAGVDYHHGGETVAMPGLLVFARSGSFETSVKTRDDGTFEFTALPNGKYTLHPEMPSSLDYDHKYESLYEAQVSDGGCGKVNFVLRPATRIRGQIALPEQMNRANIKVVAIPVHDDDEESAEKTAYTDERGRFDLWPLSPGDYLVGVNVKEPLSQRAPFPATYYPGVSTRKAAGVVHVEEGDVKEVEVGMAETGALRTVEFVAIGLDGEPMHALYVDIEDLQHPGEISGQENMGLDPDGGGTFTVLAGHAYHLHAHRDVKHRVEWCAKPVTIKPGTDRVRVRFTMDHEATACDIAEIDASSTR